MVFWGGPRQVGKTTFSQSLIANYKDGHPAYHNWDDIEDRNKIQKGSFSKDSTSLHRWHRQRRERIVYSDIRDLENVKEISNIELLIQALPERVGSPLSRKNLAQDLQVDFKTVEKWITILENVYYCYRILPFGPPKIKAVKKEQKIYFWDWSELEDVGAKWENFVASHILKFCHFVEDTEGLKMEIRFLRDIELRLALSKSFFILALVARGIFEFIAVCSFH
jgi:predicted AAA+ superfamily ATPase